LSLKIDVGCGGNTLCPFGSVEADVYCDLRKPISKLQNFVLCDVQCLPFRSNVFDEVYCIRVLGHVENPILALRELWRVSSGFIEIEVAHRCGKWRKPQLQRQAFSKTYLETVFQGHRKQFTVEYAPLLPFFITPRHIQLRVWKR